jgi:MOSC domain-containing protein YiiM
MDGSTRALVERVPQQGELTGILLRPERRDGPLSVERAEVVAGLGLVGDHRSQRRSPDPAAKRQVTLLQAEHLPVVASLMGRATLDPALLRRNLVVAGINLASLRDRRFWIGDVELEGTGWCHPCSRMEEALGPGGFQAMRGHGGITARVLADGCLRLGTTVRVDLPTTDGQRPTADERRPTNDA